MTTIRVSKHGEDDGQGGRANLVYRDGKLIGRIYTVRSRLGHHHHPVRTAYKFEWAGLPTRDPMVRGRRKDIIAELSA